jgi:hypothetical protein
MGYKIHQLDDLVTIALNFHLKFIGLSSSNIYEDTWFFIENFIVSLMFLLLLLMWVFSQFMCILTNFTSPEINNHVSL